MENLIERYNYKTITEYDSKEIIKRITEFFKDKTVIIWGAGITGHFYYDLFKRLDLKIKYFVDKNAGEINKINEIPVFTPEKLFSETENIILLIAGNPSVVKSINDDIKLMNLPANIQAKNGNDLISIARCAVCISKIKNNEKINFTECSICYNKECFCSAFIKQFEHTTGKKLPKDNKKVDFPLLGYILGQVCTLKCKHCCEALPYMKHPFQVKTEQVIADIKKAAAASNFISRVEFIGGEPFLHKGLPQILKAVTEIENVGYAMVFTNATVMPSEELIKILKHPRVVVNFSGYKATISDDLKEKVQKTKAKLIESGVNFAFYNPDSRSWFDVNVFTERNASSEQLQEYYDKCFMNNCHRLFNGEFYCCPHYYSGVQLGLNEKFPYEYIDMHKYSDDELAQQFVKFKELVYPQACKYCNLPYDAKAVPPAIQLEHCFGDI